MNTKSKIIFLNNNLLIDFAEEKIFSFLFHLYGGSCCKMNMNRNTNEQIFVVGIIKLI